MTRESIYLPGLKFACQRLCWRDFFSRQPLAKQRTEYDLLCHVSYGSEFLAMFP